MSYLGEAEDFSRQNLSNRPRRSSSYLGEAEDFPAKTFSTPKKTSSYLGEAEDFSNNNIGNIARGTTNLGTGSVATGFANPGGMPGSNKAQQFLGDNYNRFLALGYKPNEIDAQLDRALAFGRGIDVDKIENQLDKYEQFNASGFNESGVAPLLEDFDPFTGETTSKNFLNVSMPEIYANPGEGLGSLLGSMFGPFVDMAGDVLQGIGEGKVGAIGLLNKAKDAFDSGMNKGKGFLDNLNQPGTLGFRVGALTREQRRVYDDLIMNQGVSPFQAIEQAEKKAMGGITTLQ